jgi:outer membrane cobalamin receptor
MQDGYNEKVNRNRYNRKETVPGAFFEYTYTAAKFTAIAGLREDYHNRFGLITTPRLHLKYDFTPKTISAFQLVRAFAWPTFLPRMWPYL